MSQLHKIKIVQLDLGLLCYLSGNFDKRSVSQLFQKINCSPSRVQLSLITIMSNDLLFTPDAIATYYQNILALCQQGCHSYVYVGGNPVTDYIIERLNKMLIKSGYNQTDHKPRSCHYSLDKTNNIYGINHD